MAADRSKVLQQAQLLASRGQYDAAIAEWKKLAMDFPNDGSIPNAIGDLYLLGYGIIGEYQGYKSGHGLNNQLVRALLEQPDAWEIVTFGDESQAPISYIKATPL